MSIIEVRAFSQLWHFFHFLTNFHLPFQFTEEKLGNAEKTEYDGHYETLVRQCDAIKIWTEKLVAGAQSVAIPNPGAYSFVGICVVIPRYLICYSSRYFIW